MEKINKISDEEIEIVTERRHKISKESLLKRKAEIEAMLENFK